jgi:hypothetical protein
MEEFKLGRKAYSLFADNGLMLIFRIGDPRTSPRRLSELPCPNDNLGPFFSPFSIFRYINPELLLAGKLGFRRLNSENYSNRHILHVPY